MNTPSTANGGVKRKRASQSRRRSRVSSKQRRVDEDGLKRGKGREGRRGGGWGGGGVVGGVGFVRR